MQKDQLEKRFNELSEILLEEMNPQGFWEGELSSSALGVAVAVAALHFYDEKKYHKQILKGLSWLQKNVNEDGSFGDTPESPGNVSTSLLVYAACNLYTLADSETALLQGKIADYLSSQNIDVYSEQVAKVILDHYKKDYTFSVPILTMCGLCGVPGKEAFNHIPQLPFELSLVPRKFYRMLNLSVVSYAIPALVAVGIVVFKKKQSSVFSRKMRQWAIKPSLKLLNHLMPESGGFLEAIPLTAFVSLSLIESGFRDLKVVEKGILFLLETQREDGSWPIDIDLSTWVSTLAVKSLRSMKDEVLSSAGQEKLAAHLVYIHNREVHPFNGSQPGGWGWTNFSGSVPDGDDTPGTILALLQLQSKEAVKKQVLAGCDWLLRLQNKDGGFPTFSKGWGKLPFDQSCADLTGHCLLAISTSIDLYGDDLNPLDLKRYMRSFNSSLNYLKKNQRKNGSWLPLWFGNQLTADHTNPVYGTARVLTYLKDSVVHKWIDHSKTLEIRELIEQGEKFLVSVQNDDGSWGGGAHVPGTIEETALSVSAIISDNNKKTAIKGLKWLDEYYQANGLQASPIGLYFASLWYDEKLYPLTSYLEALSRSLEL
ncbi:hypothetical protein ACUNWD_08355 [Sunxiuqinia sp. A32]|uniref:hypothetical protein n=1 Tax=Sunxiuqinia sp. A32 TaxID=3461496 RepID=UPI00404587E7